MRNIIVIFSVILISAALLLLITTTLRFNTYKLKDKPVEIDQADIDYFMDTYEDSRAAFLELSGLLKNRFAGCETFEIRVPSSDDQDLTLSILHIPAQKKMDRLLSISVAVHGVEGSTGSAVARMIMNEFITDETASHTGFLILHAVNPYGFKYSRRVTENNVDLNRNSDIGNDLYETVNEGYREVYDLLNPSKEADVSSLSNRFFHVRAVSMLLKGSIASLRQAILQGQYEFPEGLYFGGDQQEPQIKDLIPVVSGIMNRYPLVLHIDLHTGYGERGTLHLFPNPIEEADIIDKLEQVFDGYAIDWGDDDDFYTVTGSFTDFLGDLMNDGVYLPMVFEYGTMDSQTLLGSLKSLHVTLLENQGFVYGYRTPEDEERIKRDFVEMYYPSSPEWRIKVMHDSRKIMDSAIKNFAKISN